MKEWLRVRENIDEDKKGGHDKKLHAKYNYHLGEDGRPRNEVEGVLVKAPQGRLWRAPHKGWREEGRRAKGPEKADGGRA